MPVRTSGGQHTTALILDMSLYLMALAFSRIVYRDPANRVHVKCEV